MNRYEAIQTRLARGWNTWNTRSVLSHVHLPEGFAINLCLKHKPSSAYLKEALIGRRGDGAEIALPGPHAYDGSYSEVQVQWKGLDITVQSAWAGDDLVLLVTPVVEPAAPALLVVEAGMLWNRPGFVGREDGSLVARMDPQEFRVYATRQAVRDPYIPNQSAYLALPLDGPVGISTGIPRSLEEIGQLVEQQRAAQAARAAAFGELAEIYEAIQTCIAWDTIYEPERERVVTPVSRLWNVTWGGFVLFDWDTYFAAYLASIDNKELAYANAIEITREHTEAGFVPNFGTVQNLKSRDRSQPPVGALVFRELYRRYRDRWLLEKVFDDLLAWNRWWPGHRCQNGLLAWGSDPYQPLLHSPYEINHINHWQGAAWESGLDNSPMYDDVPYDAEKHIMLLADVGLNGLYVMDCAALAEIADELGRAGEAQELRSRESAFRAALVTLWDEEIGFFSNRRLDTGAWNRRSSPTNFYALLGRAATDAQVARMLQEHFYNPDEFWGEWILPTTPRNDPAFTDQDYWRGRIWGPTNFLAYLGLRNYPVARQACADLAEKSKALFLKNWRERRYVAENYNSITGAGGEVGNSDRYYHWGGLLGLLALIEAGVVPGPEQPLAQD